MERDYWRLLKRYRDGECTPDEIARVPAVLKTAIGRQTILALLKAVDLRTDAPEFDDSAKAYAELERRLAGRGMGASTYGLPRNRSRREPFEGKRLLGTQILRKWLWLAGVVVSAIILGFLDRTSTTRDPGVTRTYATGPLQRAVLRLTDGTLVTLSPSTTLRLDRFGVNARTVRVNGEAYFEVSKLSGALFSVRGGNITARVLGTAFLVRHFDGDARMHIAVAEGKVNVAGRAVPRSGLTLTAGHIGDISDSVTHVEAVDDVIPNIERRGNELVFRHTPVPKILETLTRWYGYKFQCADSSLIRQSVTIGLSMRSSADALSTLEELLSVNLTMTGDTVTLAPRLVPRTKASPRTRNYEVWTPTREVGR